MLHATVSVFILLMECELVLCGDKTAVNGSANTTTPIVVEVNRGEVPLDASSCLKVSELAELSSRVLNVTAHLPISAIGLFYPELAAACAKEWEHKGINPHTDSVGSDTISYVIDARGLSATLVSDVHRARLEFAGAPAAGTRSPSELFGAIHRFIQGPIAFLRHLSYAGFVRSSPLLASSNASVSLIDFVCNMVLTGPDSVLTVRPLCKSIDASLEAIIEGLLSPHLHRRDGHGLVGWEDLVAVQSVHTSRCVELCTKLESLRDFRHPKFLRDRSYKEACFCEGLDEGSSTHVSKEICPSGGAEQPPGFCVPKSILEVGVPGADDQPHASEDGIGSDTGAESGRSDKPSRRTSEEPPLPGSIPRGASGKRGTFTRRLGKYFGRMAQGARTYNSTRLGDGSESFEFFMTRTFYSTGYLWLPQLLLFFTFSGAALGRWYGDTPNEKETIAVAVKFVALIVSVFFAFARLIDGEGDEAFVGITMSDSYSMRFLEMCSVLLCVFMSVATLVAPDRTSFNQSTAVQWLCGTVIVYMMIVVASEFQPHMLLPLFSVVLVANVISFVKTAAQASSVSDPYPTLILFWNLIACAATELWAANSVLSDTYAPSIAAFVYVLGDYLPYSMPTTSNYFITRSILYLDDAIEWAAGYRVSVHQGFAPLLMLTLRFWLMALPRCVVGFRTVRFSRTEQPILTFLYSGWVYLIDMTAAPRYLFAAVTGSNFKMFSGMFLMQMWLTISDWMYVQEIFWLRLGLSTVWFVCGFPTTRLIAASCVSDSVRLFSKEFKIPGALPTVAVNDVYRMVEGNFRVEMLDESGTGLSEGTCVIYRDGKDAVMTTIEHVSDCVGTPASIKIVGTSPHLKHFIGYVFKIEKPSLLPNFPKDDPVTRFRLVENRHDHAILGFIESLNPAFPDATQDDIAGARMVYVHTFDKTAMRAIQDLSLSFECQKSGTRDIGSIAVQVCMSRGDSGGGAFLVLDDGSVRYLGAISRAVPSVPSNIVSVVGTAAAAYTEVRRMLSIPFIKALKNFDSEGHRDKRVKAQAAAVQASKAYSLATDEVITLTQEGPGDDAKKKRIEDKKANQRNKQNAQKRANAALEDIRNVIRRDLEESLGGFTTELVSEEYTLPGSSKLLKTSGFNVYGLMKHFLLEADEDQLDSRLTEVFDYIDKIVDPESRWVRK